MNKKKKKMNKIAKKMTVQMNLFDRKKFQMEAATKEKTISIA